MGEERRKSTTSTHGKTPASYLMTGKEQMWEDSPLWKQPTDRLVTTVRRTVTQGDAEWRYPCIALRNAELWRYAAHNMA